MAWKLSGYHGLTRVGARKVCLGIYRQAERERERGEKKESEIERESEREREREREKR